MPLPPSNVVDGYREESGEYPGLTGEAAIDIPEGRRRYGYPAGGFKPGQKAALRMSRVIAGLHIKTSGGDCPPHTTRTIKTMLVEIRSLCDHIESELGLEVLK